MLKVYKVYQVCCVRQICSIGWGRGEGGKGKKKKNQLALFCDFVALIKRLSDRGEEGTE